MSVRKNIPQHSLVVRESAPSFALQAKRIGLPIKLDPEWWPAFRTATDGRNLRRVQRQMADAMNKRLNRNQIYVS